MKNEWKNLLTGAGAEFDESGSVQSYGSPVRERNLVTTGDVFADLSHQALIAVHGEDAQSFLQGQFSNDVAKVDAGHSQLNSYCSPKGRMLATFRLFQRGDHYYLSMPQELVEGTLQRLRMFVMRADVSFEEVTDSFVHLGVSGTNAATTLEEALGGIPAAIDEVVAGDDFTLIRVPGEPPRFEAYTSLERAKKLWEKLNVRCAPVGTPAWRLLDLLAGIPTVYTETREAFVPQMANYQLINGVSFQKGCYPGQEVVARMQYLGKLKRRMYLLKIDSDDTPPPGTDLYTAADGEQSAGKLVEAQPRPDGGQAALAVLQIASADAGELHLGSADGPAVHLMDLPYAFAPVEREG